MSGIEWVTCSFAEDHEEAAPGAGGWRTCRHLAQIQDCDDLEHTEVRAEDCGRCRVPKWHAALTEAFRILQVLRDEGGWKHAGEASQAQIDKALAEFGRGESAERGGE